jgi:hypothetical protein
MDLISTQQRSQLQASPAAQPTAAAGNYAAAEVETQADKQRIMDSIRQQVGHVIDCLVCMATLASAGCTVDQLWTWRHAWGKARFQHYFGKLRSDGSTDTFLNAVKQWAQFCEATYPDCAPTRTTSPQTRWWPSLTGGPASRARSPAPTARWRPTLVRA